MLQAIAKRAARRRGFADHRLLLRRALTGIGVQIWRRAAAMIRSCIPAGSQEAVALAYGVDATAGDDADGDGPVTAAFSLVAADGPGFLMS